MAREIVCDHGDASGVGRVCLHLLADHYGHDQYRCFTGNGIAYDLVCGTCRDNLRHAERHLRAVCMECFEAVGRGRYPSGYTGLLPVERRATGLSFAHEDIDMRGVLPPRIVALRPLDAEPSGIWIALTSEGEVVRVDLAARTVTTLATMPYRLHGETMLHMSPDGRLAAVVETYGRHGTVIDLETGVETMPLERGEYHCDVSVFPATFAALDGRTLLVHGAD